MILADICHIFYIYPVFRKDNIPKTGLFYYIPNLYEPMTLSKQLFTSSATVGEMYPVMIRIDHQGRSIWIPTEIQCKSDNWSADSCTISPSDPDFLWKNESIEAQLRRVAGKIQDNLDNFLFHNLEDIIKNICRSVVSLEELSHISGQSKFFSIVQAANYNVSAGSHTYSPFEMSFRNLIESKIESMPALNTRRGYRSYMNYFMRKYGDGPKLYELDRNMINKFTLEIQQDYRNRRPTMNLMLSRMKAVLNYGRDNGWISSTVIAKIPAKLMVARDRNLSAASINKIFNIFKISMGEDPQFKMGTTFALGIFVLGIAFQGLAPVDIASLKVGQLKFLTISPPPACNSKHGAEIGINDFHYNEAIDVIIVKTARQKTGQEVMIVAASNPIKPFIDHLIQDKVKDDYLLPCFDKKRDYTESQRQDRLSNYFHKLSKDLNKALETSDVNRDDTGEFRKITYYYARHAFCNLIDGLDVPRHLIQHMIGHRTSVLETNYLRKITPWEQANLSRIILSSLL